MKKMLVLLVALMLTIAMVIPAAAGNGPGSGGKGGATGTGPGTGQKQQGARGTFAFSGTITATGTDTVTIHAIRGNKLVQPYLGTQVTVTVTPGTRYLYRDGTTITMIGFADLEIGQPVSVNGILSDNVWTISRITVGASLSCLP